MDRILGAVCLAVFFIIIIGGIVQICQIVEAKQLKKELKERTCGNCSRCSLIIGGTVTCERFPSTTPMPEFCDEFSLRRVPLPTSYVPMPKTNSGSTESNRVVIGRSGIKA